MRILKVWDGEYPWDVRTEKVCQALTAGGHQVATVARNRDGRATMEALEECVVHRLSPWSMLGKSLDAASQFPAFFNPRWVRLLMSVGRRMRPDLILCRDLPLAPTAIFAARRLKVPMVLDMAENYPGMIRDLWHTKATKFGDSLVRNPWAVAVVERWTVARADHIIVVVDESKDRLARMGVPPDRVTIVGNTPPLERLDRFTSLARSVDEAPLHMVYLGLLEKARGVAAGVEAVAICRSRGTRIRFTVIGEGRGRRHFEALAQRLGLRSDDVQFHGFMPYEQALSIVARCDVGLIPHLPSESWNSTIPNKLFDYMAAGLSVLTSDAAPTRRVVEQTGCGLWFRGGDPGHLADQLEALSRERDRGRRGAAGRAAVRERFNWEADSGRLLDALERIGAGSRMASHPRSPE